MNKAKTFLIKIGLETNVKNAIQYVINLYNDNKADTVNLVGLNSAISKVILITEVLKTKIKGLHQVNNIDCMITKDKYNANKTKRIPRISIILTVIEPICKDGGYQEPVEYCELEQFEDFNLEDKEESDGEYEL